jgi:hypothetical protein
MKNKDNSISQESFVYQWFLARPDRDIPHSESKQQIESEWFQAFGTRFEDVDRAIRRLSQEGKLKKITKGVYRLTNNYEHKPKDGFSDLCRNSIFERDRFKCRKCPDFEVSDVELVALHVLPVSTGGESVLSNGITLCPKHALVHILTSDRKQGRALISKIYDQVFEMKIDDTNKSHVWNELLRNITEVDASLNELLRNWAKES